MNKSIKSIIFVCLLWIAQTGFACDYPEHVTVPSGTTATKQDMLATQKLVKAFVASMEAYTDCIVEEEKVSRLAMEDLTPEAAAQREEMLNKKYNAAVDDMETVAAQFNAEVQVYKKRGEKKDDQE